MKRKSRLRFLIWGPAVAWVIPLGALFVASFRPFREIVHGWWVVGEQFTFGLNNYARALGFSAAPISRGLANSLIIVVPSTILPIAVAFLAGYVLSRYRPRYGPAFLVILVLFIVMPSEALLIPIFQVFNNIGLNGTRTAVVLVQSARAVPWITVFLLNYFNRIPRTFEEAAVIDGADYWTILGKIMVPLSIPALISLAVLQFVGAWNTFIWALLFLQPVPRYWTAVQMIPAMRGAEVVDWGLLSAASVLVLLVPVGIFLTLHRYYVQGLIGTEDG